VIANHPKPGTRREGLVDRLHDMQQVWKFADPWFNVRRRNGDADADAGTHNEGGRERFLQLTKCWIVDIDNEFAYLGRGMARASAKRFVGPSVNEKPDDFGDAEAG